MRYDPNVLSRLAAKLGVVRNTLEKVIRLAEILRFINSSDVLMNKLALKGGTAINLLYSDLPRLSVDIDLDYAVNEKTETMLLSRESIRQTLEAYFITEGYILSKHSRYSFALDSFVISYTPSGGGSDNIKVEINYVMRSHVLPLEHKQLNLGIIENPFLVLTVSKIEIYAGKINALLSRNQIRDLYDTYQMINNQFLNDEEIITLKNIVLFYRYIQNDSLAFNSNFNQRFTKRSYVRDLLPVIKKGDTFHLEQAIESVSIFIGMITDYDENQHQFIRTIENDNPHFELLFQDEKIKDLAENHPLTHWKKIKKVTL
ncbi:MAG: nucleotidyl transferase AbiEii/AbiGii toxin family protein [Candidatus Izemoplasmatales bacterium]|nr:nucleotidyl transferase AbiEii/AbiGii toxin family protein [Candidatus Izemoplasmatales bacterium]